MKRRRPARKNRRRIARKTPRRGMRILIVSGDPEFLNRTYLDPAIKNGDWDLLAEFLDQGGYDCLTLEMGVFLSKVLRDEMPRKRGRRKERRTTDTYIQIGEFVRSAIHDGMNLAAAKRAAKAEFKQSVKNIERAIKYLEEAERIHRELGRLEEERPLDWNEYRVPRRVQIPGKPQPFQEYTPVMKRSLRPEEEDDLADHQRGLWEDYERDKK
jgi:hypothetical protein